MDYRDARGAVPFHREVVVPDKRTETLAWFAEQMRAKMELRRDKGDDWREMGIDQLWALMEEEAQTELLPEWDCLRPNWANVIAEAADVSNYCMMIADTARGMLAEADRTDIVQTAE